MKYALKKHLSQILVCKYCKSEVYKGKQLQKSKLRYLDNFWDRLKVMTIKYEQKFHLFLYLFKN